MNNQIIIHPNEEGGIAVIHPAPGINMTIEEVAKKDVPKGLPYIITTVDVLPPDRYFRNAWTTDFTNAPINQ